MNESTRKALLELSRRFYRRRAGSFSASRRRPWPGWDRILERVFDADPLRVLDLGCGNARFATYLGARRAGRIDYLGIDSSSELLELARRRLEGPDDLRVEARLEHLDVAHDAWIHRLAGRSFHLIVLFGVLHHVPGRASRLELLRRSFALLEPEGVLAASLWRFDRQPRIAEKILPWEEYNRRAPRPVDVAELEAGDHLLTWAGERDTPRYAHLSDGAEIAELGRELPCLDRFAADGPQGENNLYMVFGRPAGLC